MAEPVIVPVQLEVTDIDASNMNFKDVQKTISSQMSTIKKSIQDAFSGIDASAINKPIEQAMTSVKKSVQAAEDAQLKYNEALVRAAKSNPEYGDAIKAIDDQIAEIEKQMATWATKAGTVPEQIRKAYAPMLEDLRKKKKELNPADFINDNADPIKLEKLAIAYKKVLSAQENVNKKSEEFNQTAKDNKMSDDYNELLKQAEAYKKELEELKAKSERMAAIGATDKQWDALRYDTEQASSSLNDVVEKLKEAVKTGKAFRFGAGDGDKGKALGQISGMQMAGGLTSGDIKKTAKANQSPFTKDYQAALDELDKLEKKMVALREKSDKMVATGASEKQFASLNYDAAQLSGKVDEVRARLLGMVNEGKAFRFGDGDTAGEMDRIINKTGELNTEFEKLATKSKEAPNKLSQGLAGASSMFGRIQSALTTATNGLSNFGNSHTNLSGLTDMLGKVTSGLGSISGKASTALSGLSSLAMANPKIAVIMTAISGVSKALKSIGQFAVRAGKAIVNGFTQAVQTLKKVGQAVGRVAKGFADVGKRIVGSIKNMTGFGKSGGKVSNDLNKRFKKLGRNILMFGLGFRTAYYAVKRLRTVFTEGFKVMGSQFDAIGKPMTDMMESFNRLKGSLATAFQPLVSVVMPILTQAMDRLSDMMEAIAKFGATLTGQGKIYKAVAKNIDTVSDSASGANKQLGSYDKLDVIQQDNGTGYDYEEEVVNAQSAIAKFGDMVKQAWANADFTAVGQYVTTQLLGVLSTIETNVMPKITDFANRVLKSINTFLTGFDAKAVGNAVSSIIDALVNGLDWAQLGALFANIQNTVWGFLSGLVNGIDWANLGISVAEGITSMFATLDLNSWVSMISGLVNGITTAIANLIANTDWKAVAEKLGDAVNNLFKNIDLGKVGTTINNLVTSLWTLVGNFVTTIDFGAIVSSIAEGLNNAFSTDSGAFVYAFASANVGIANAIATIITTAIKEIDWDGILNMLLDSIQFITKSLGDAMANSDNPLIAVFGEVILAINETITMLRPVVEDLIAALGPIIEGILPIISQLLPPITEAFAMLVNMVLPVLLDILDAVWPILQMIIDTLLEHLFDALETLQPLFDAISNVILPAVLRVIEALWPFIKGVSDLLVDILNPILALIGPLLEIITSILDPITILLAPILKILGTLCGLIGDVLRPILDALLPVMQAVSSVFQLLTPIFEYCAIPLEWIADVFVFLAGIVKAVVVPGFEILGRVIQAIMNIVIMVVDAVKVAISSLKTAFDWLWSKIKIPLNGIIGFLEWVANAVIRSVNFIIRALNKLSFDVPDWVPGIGGQKFGFNIKEIKEISIPRLAQGAVIPPNKEFLAVLGDQKHGTNIEAPLETIKQALAEVMAELGGMGNQQPIVLQVNGRTLAQVVWDEQQKRYKQTGKSMA